MTLIPALIYSSIITLLVNSLMQEHITHKATIQNYANCWKIICLLEEDALRVLNLQTPLNSQMNIISSLNADVHNAPSSNIINTQQLTLRYNENTNYTLFIQIVRQIDPTTKQIIDAKITAWHFGA